MFFLTKSFIQIAATISFIAIAAMTKADETPIFSGPYIGASVGYNHIEVDEGKSNWVYSDNTSFLQTGKNSDSDDALYALNAGYNWRFDNKVVGLEFDGTKIDGRSKGLASDYSITNGVVTDRLISATKINALFTARAKFGVVFDKLMVYGTAGLAIAGIDRKITQLNDGKNDYSIDRGTSDSLSKTKFGPALGVGLEYALPENLSLKLQYLYTDFGNVKYKYSGGFNSLTVNGHQKVGIDNSMLSIGLNYAF